MTANPPRTDPHIERASAEDAERILPIIQAAFPHWPAMQIDGTPLDYARWKMQGPEGAPPHPHTMVVEASEVVAVELRWLAWAQVGDNVLPFDRGTDVAVHPDHQGRGLARLIFDDDVVRNPPLAPFIRWDTPSNDEKVLHLDVGDQVLRGLRVWARALTPRAFLGLHRQAGPAHLARSLLAAATRRGRSRQRGATTYRVERLTAFDARTNDLWERARTVFDIARVRDAALMNWRYLDPRGGRPATVLATRTPEGDLAAYLVAKRTAHTTQLLDLVADPAHLPAAAALLQAATEAYRAEGCTQLVCWLPPGHPLEGALRSTGFLDTAQRRDVMFETTWMTGAPEAIATVNDPASRLHVMLGDFDFV